MTSRELRLLRRPLLLSTGMVLAAMLALPALAQQTPLTGRMLGNQPHATTSTAKQPAPATKPTSHPSQPKPEQTQPATTYPAALPPSEQASQTPPPAPQAPMPAYTNLHTMPSASAIAEADMGTPPPAAFGTPIGGTTEQLLRMQASNRHAGPSLPMLGDEADAAYQRYIDSFKHPIPEFFKTTVESGSGSGSGLGSGLGQ